MFIVNFTFMVHALTFGVKVMMKFYVLKSKWKVRFMVKVNVKIRVNVLVSKLRFKFYG
jgi:hypothetical protein